MSNIFLSFHREQWVSSVRNSSADSLIRTITKPLTSHIYSAAVCRSEEESSYTGPVSIATWKNTYCLRTNTEVENLYLKHELIHHLDLTSSHQNWLVNTNCLMWTACCKYEPNCVCVCVCVRLTVGGWWCWGCPQLSTGRSWRQQHPEHSVERKETGSEVFRRAAFSLAIADCCCNTWRLTLMSSRAHTARTVCRFLCRLLSITHMVSWPFLIWDRASSSLRAPPLLLGEGWGTHTHTRARAHTHTHTHTRSLAKSNELQFVCVGVRVRVCVYSQAGSRPRSGRWVRSGCWGWSWPVV